MKISDLIAKVTGLEQRATESFKAELAELKATISGALAEATQALANAKSELTTALASNVTLTGLKETLAAENTKLKTESAALASFNSELTTACLNGGLLLLNGEDGKPIAADATDEQKQKAAAAISISDKFKAYQGAHTAAFAKLGLPNTMLPPAPPKSPGVTSSANSISRADFFKLTPRAQLDFVNGGGKVTE